MKIFPGLTLFCTTFYLLFGVAGKPNDVLLSCSGEDVRKSFVDHLHSDLTRAGFSTFREDDGILIGEIIPVEIQRALHESKLVVVVFSNEYPKSTRCLDELAMIMERRRVYGYTVVPVYYNVKLIDVKEHTGTYGEAFAVHETFDRMMDKVEKWRKVLKETTDIRGWHLNNGFESPFINKIVKDVQHQLNSTMRNPNPYCKWIILIIFSVPMLFMLFKLFSIRNHGRGRDRKRKRKRKRNRCRDTRL